MSRFRRFELFEEEEPFRYYSSSPLFFSKTLTFPSFVEDSLSLDLDHFLLPSPFDAVTDLVRVVDRAPSIWHRRVHRVERQQLGTELCLRNLSDRVAELESRFDRLLSGKSCGGGGGRGGDRKYTWTAEIKGPEKNGFDRKYQWVADIVEEEEEKSSKLKSAAKNIKWTAEIKGKGEDSGGTRKYTFEVKSDDAEKKKKKKKGSESENENEKEKEKVKEKKEKKKVSGVRIVEIEEPSDHRDVVLRQVG